MRKSKSLVRDMILVDDIINFTLHSQAYALGQLVI